MFEHLQLQTIGTFDGCELGSLGKVNIICGKNNSGKTTLLTSIHDPKNRSLGLTPTTDRLEAIIKASITAVVNSDSSAHRSSFESQFRQLMETIYLKRSVWRPEDITAFQERWRSAQQVHPNLVMATKLRSDPAIIRTYAGLFKDYRTALISPQRAIESEPEIRTDAEVGFNGKGLINRLFFCRTQVTGSPDRLFFEALSTAFEEISGGCRFDIITGERNTLQLLFNNRPTQWIQAASSGLGLQDLLVILYFAHSDRFPVILLEEPESHLHPEMQRRLLHFLTVETNKQYFVTTHSNVFLDTTFARRVFLTKFSDHIDVVDETSRAAILSDLGYEVADNLAAAVVVLVEGPKDVPVLEQLLLKLGVYGRYDLKIWPLGGDIMDQLDLSVFLHGPKVRALIDRDPKSDKVRRRFMENCDRLRIPVVRLQRYAIENYFSLAALREVLGAKIRTDLTSIDPDTKISDQIGINVKGNNRQLAAATEISDLEGTDLLEFLRDVAALCKR